MGTPGEWNGMLTDQITTILCENGFRRIQGNVTGISMNYVEDNGGVRVVIHVLSYEGTEFSMDQLDNIKLQVKAYFGQQDKRAIILFVLYTNSPLAVRSFSEQMENCWIADLSEQHLLIYENQPAEFAGTRILIENFLLERGTEHYYREEVCSRTNAPKNLGKGIQRYISPCNTALILLCAAVFLVMDLFCSAEQISRVFEYGSLYWPAIFQGHEYYRLLTYMFLHSGFEHLANNMLVLLFIGDNVERAFGKWRYLVIYFSSGVIAGIVSIVYNMSNGNYTFSIGASGAVFGIIGAMACLLLLNRGRLENITLPRIIFFIFLSLYGGFTSQGIDNAAHVGGLAAGILVTALLWVLRRRKREN